MKIVKCIIKNCKNETMLPLILCTTHTVIWGNSEQGRQVMDTEKDVNYAQLWEEFLALHDKDNSKE